MGFALSLSAALLAPLQCIVQFFAPWARPEPQQAGRTHSAAPANVVSLRAAAPVRQAHPVRVVHVIERGSLKAGRVVISGRMADVCAELERLAALEAAAP